MAEPLESPSPSPAIADEATSQGSVGGFGDAASICPFLQSREGAWTSAFGSRDLRCWAVDPPAAPSIQEQRQLCVVPAHAACATYRAAMAPDPIARDHADALGLWPAAAAVPVALEGVHVRPSVTVASPKVGGQALLVGLMIVAFLVLVVARTGPLASVAAPASPSPATSAVAAIASASLVPAIVTPEPSSEVTPSPAAPSATPEPSPTPSPSATPRTYRVRSGDTVAGIAAKFHTTVKAIVKANNIVDPRTIHAGEVLVIP
jgi:LysM repeat protein